MKHPTDRCVRRSLPRLLPLGVLLALVCLGATTAIEATPVSTIERHILLDRPFVHIDLTLGDLDIRAQKESPAGSAPTVTARLELRCSSGPTEAECRRRAQRIRLVPRIKDDRLRLELQNTPRGRLQGISAYLHVEIPPQARVEVDIRSGDVSVSGLRGSLEIDSGVGRVDVVHSLEVTGKVDVDVGVGKADLWTPEGHIEGSGFPRSVLWRGSGPHPIEIDLGSGDVIVRLE